MKKTFTLPQILKALKQYKKDKEAQKKKLKASAASPDEIEACIVCIKMLIREIPKYFQ